MGKVRQVHAQRMPLRQDGVYNLRSQTRSGSSKAQINLVGAPSTDSGIISVKNSHINLAKHSKVSSDSLINRTQDVGYQEMCNKLRGNAEVILLFIRLLQKRSGNKQLIEKLNGMHSLVTKRLEKERLSMSSLIFLEKKLKELTELQTELLREALDLD